MQPEPTGEPNRNHPEVENLSLQQTPFSDKKVAGRLTLLTYQSLPPVVQLLEIARTAEPNHTTKLTTSSELGLLKEHLPGEFYSFAGSGTKPAPNSFHAAKALQSLLGPLDDTILNYPDTVDNRWLRDKERKLDGITRKAGVKVDSSLCRKGSPLDKAIGIKLTALECLKHLELPLAKVSDTQGTNDTHTHSVPPSRFDYVKEYSTLLGNNLVGVVAYGGSVTTPADGALKDFDNFVIVNDVKEALRQLQSQKLSHHGIPINSHVVPAETYEKYLLASYDPGCQPSSMRVIYGDTALPEVSPQNLLSIGYHLSALSIFNKRTALLSTFIRSPEIFADEVKKSPKSIALIESFTVSPLATLAWTIRLRDYPNEPKLAKREAVAWLLKTLDLPPLASCFSSPLELLALPKEDLQIALVGSIVTAYLALEKTLPSNCTTQSD